jgi:protein subunit release factor A
MDESELRVDVWRQAVSSPEVRVRVTHLPTGLTAEATGEGEQRMRQVALTAMEAALTANARGAAI